MTSLSPPLLAISEVSLRRPSLVWRQSRRPFVKIISISFSKAVFLPSYLFFVFPSQLNCMVE